MRTVLWTKKKAKTEKNSTLKLTVALVPDVSWLTLLRCISTCFAMVFDRLPMRGVKIPVF